MKPLTIRKTKIWIYLIYLIGLLAVFEFAGRLVIECSSTPSSLLTTKLDEFPFFSLKPSYVSNWVNVRNGRRELLPRGERSRRIAFVGDSATFGVGVEDSRIFTEVLQKEDNTTDFYNFGVPGYGIPEIESLVNRLAESGEYDSIVYLYNYNDIFPSMSGLLQLLQDPKHRFRVIENYQGLHGMVKLFLKDHMKSLFAIKACYNSFFSKKSAHGIGYSPTIPPQSETQLEQMALRDSLPQLMLLWEKAYADPTVARDLGNIVSGMKRVCEDHGVNFIVAVHHDYYFVKHSMKIPRTIIESTFRKLDVNFLDTYPMYREHYLETGFYSDPGHLGVVGHRAMAALLKKVMTRSQT